MAFTPFMQGTKAQGIINDYLGGKMNATPNVNSAGMWRNPHFDLRTEQEAAGTLDPTALYPNPQIDFSAQDDLVDPCREGFMLVDGVCQPIETFGQSAYNEQRNDNPDDPPREYYSIDEMKELDDYELLKYLDDGWLKGDKFDSTIGGNFLPLQFQLPFGGQNKMRRDFIIDELTRRGYSTGVNDKGQNTFNLGNVFGIIGNAEASKLGFTPEEINYQIQAKNQSDAFSGNPYAETMTEQQVIDDAIASGATSVNPYERFGINQNSGNQNNNNNNTFVPSGNFGNNFYQGNKGYGDADDWSDDSSGI
jgi:hypothetical protein